MMRILNFKAKKFAVGRMVMIKLKYQSGNINLDIGDCGKIVGESYVDLPDMGLFNIRVLDLDFGQHKFSVGEGIAETFMDAV